MSGYAPFAKIIGDTGSMYSLVSAPVLGFDLCRLDGGPAAAGILGRALSLQPQDLKSLSDRLPDDDERLRLWADIEQATRALAPVSALPGKGGATALALLERAPIGTVDALLHCVRHEILDWSWQDTADGQVQSEEAARATAAVCDAVAASYLRPFLPAPTRRALAKAWMTATHRAPVRPAELGPQEKALNALFARLREAGPGDLQRLQRAVDDGRSADADWAPAIHSASWAVYVSGRIHAAAAAQFELVLAVDEAGIPVADRAAGVWNLLSGTVQALVVRDVLGEDPLHRLIAPTITALGPYGLL